MATYVLTVNGVEHSVEAEPKMPLLWVLRDVIGLTGTKYGCGIGQCGSCTVLLNGSPGRSCQRSISSIGDERITTIEGLSESGDHPLQVMWDELNVSQCGFCQPGQILTAFAMLRSRPNPTDADIDREMSRNLCRCGTYIRIKEAIKQAAGLVED